MRNRVRWIVNILFLIIGCMAVAALIIHIRRHSLQDEPEPILGFEVFCSGEEISALFSTEDCLWIGGRDGIKRLDCKTGEIIDYVAKDLELIYAAEICRSEDGSIWVGHNDGVTVFTQDGTRMDFSAPDLTGGRVNSILCVEDRVWVGSMEGANLLELQDEIWTVSKKYTKEDGLLADPVNVMADFEGQILFGSYLDNRPGGISILTSSGWQYLTVEDGLAHPYINAILPVEDKILVACGQLTSGGLNQIEAEKGSLKITDTFDTQDSIPGEKVRWLYLDNNGFLWITTESDGLILTQAAELTHPIDGIVLTWEQGLSDNEIKKIAETNDYYFLAGRYGLTRIEKQALMNLMEDGNYGGK